MGGFRLCALALAVLAAGCTSLRQANTLPVADRNIPPPTPPVFLSGSMGVLLTNADGFRAQVLAQIRLPSEATKSITGELLGRGSKLLFASNEPVSGKGRHPADRLSFLWDVAGGTGYVLSEALQAYAPITSNVRFTNVVVEAGRAKPAAEKSDGPLSQPEEVIVASSEGRTTRFHVWRAAVAQGVPIRIESLPDPPAVILSLSKIQSGPLPGELFLAPEGFTRYDSAEGMMNELLSRQQNLKRDASRWSGEPDRAGGWEGRRDRGSR